jgi:tetratricopeptide (TPR) repeat protein
VTIHRFALVCLASCITLVAQDSPDGPEIRRELGMGVQAFRQGHFAEAAKYFEKAIQVNPQAVNPHLYLGTALASQWTPGLETPENLATIRRAESEFMMVLQVEPEQLGALQSLANLAYQRAMAMPSESDKWEQLTRAQGWFEHLSEASPKRKMAFYMYGVIAWNKCQPPIDDARQKSGMKADATEPISDAALRSQLHEKCWGVLEDGVEHLKKGLDANPDYDDAMTYISILTRQKANLEDSLEASRRDVKEADDWAEKAAAAKKRNASKPKDDSDE